MESFQLYTVKQCWRYMHTTTLDVKSCCKLTCAMLHCISKRFNRLKQENNEIPRICEHFTLKNTEYTGKVIIICC